MHARSNRLAAWFQRLALFLTVVGPGVITSVIDNDAGGIAVYSVVGSHFGTTMLWILVPMTVSLIVVQEMAARMGVVTGKGLADLIRENFGVRATFYIMCASLIADIGTTISEFAGVAIAMELFGIPKYVSVPVAALIVWLIVTRMNYRNLEKVFLGAIVFFGTYIVSAFFVKPPWGSVLTQLVIPQNVHFDSHYMIVLVGFVGTTITPWMQFYLQSSIAAKGIPKEDYPYCRWDVILGGVLTNLITFCIIVTCAFTLFKNGVRIDDAQTAAMALKPVAGPYCFMLFALGLLNASLAAAAILPLTTAYYVCEGLGWEAGVDKPFEEAAHFYTLYGLMILIGAGVVLIPQFPLWRVMLVSQVAYGVLLPFLLIFMLLLVNRKDIMGIFVNSRLLNIIAWTTALVMILLTGAMVFTTIVPKS